MSNPIYNGPAIVPNPIGPQPTDGFEYITLPPQPPLKPSGADGSGAIQATIAQQIEDHLGTRGAQADTVMLPDGTRVWRVAQRTLWLLEHDALGPIVRLSAKSFYRCSTVNPTSGFAVIWRNIAA